MVKEVSSAALKGKKTSSARTSYVRSQQQAKVAASSGRGKGSKAMKKAAAVQAKAAQAARAKAFSSKTANKARDAYKAARSKAREAVMLAGGRTSTRGVRNEGLRTTVKAAQAAAKKVKAMEQKRGVSGRKRTSKKR